MAAVIDVFYWPTPNGHKVTIALEEMGLSYKVTPINIGKGEQFKPDFLEISPNNRMPAIVDPDGPGGAPVSVFESGAILQYLARKTGRFYGANERNQIEVEEWLYWQMAGLGPMTGQANHFRMYAPTVTLDQRQVAYGANRYVNEVNRLTGVLDKRLAGREYVCGDFSIADMAIFPWVQRQNAVLMAEFTNVAAYTQRVLARPAVAKALAVADEVRRNAAVEQSSATQSEEARRILFNQRAR
jgi:glutathione S-transferase/GST-like protein